MLRSAGLIDGKGDAMADLNDRVRVHYRGTFDDGTQFDSSYEAGEPIEFVVGDRNMIPGFNLAMLRMGPGETLKIHLEPREAYGEYREDLVEQIPCQLMPNWERMPIGVPVTLRVQGGQEIRVTCQKVEDGVMYLDHNHPLAGKALNFEIELVEVCNRESAIEREKHAEGCACGCHKMKDMLLAQNAEAAELEHAAREAEHGHEHGHDCGCGHHHG